jgi:hypothetical protein
MLRSIIAGYFLVLLVSVTMFAQDEKPLPINICDLQKNPDVYNHKRIRVQGVVNHEFEDFSIRDAGCPDFNNTVWLMYGGEVSDDVTYCCNITGNKNKVNIEGVEVSIRHSAALDRFRKLLNSYRINKKAKVHYFQTDPSFSVTATLVGRFFAGNGSPCRGFGHMGCFTLLVIDQVLSIDNVVSNIKPGELSCYTEGWYENADEKEQTVKQNAIAKSGDNWRMKDPRRVATEALNSHLNNSGSTPEFVGCKTKHLTYPDKKNDQFRAYCHWKSDPADTFAVEVAKYYFLRNSSNSWKSIAWMPCQVLNQHCSENPKPE